MTKRKKTVVAAAAVAASVLEDVKVGVKEKEEEGGRGREGLWG